ncbi:hypothetical protein ACFXB3_07070 [Streptomyces sp. NPDC059447]|uniref:hypothetical protein n=1 Tax=Streptomyces sp. NPDC059447 TaxID=3346834 RepID=UPI0036C413A0
MNTKAIGAAAEVIFRAMSRNGVVPATIAVALDANGLLSGPDAAEQTMSLRSEIAELRIQLATAERQNAELDERLAERDHQLDTLLEGAGFDEKAVPA